MKQLKNFFFLLVLMADFFILANVTRTTLGSEEKNQLLSIFHEYESLHQTFFDGKYKNIPTVAEKVLSKYEQIKNAKLIEEMKNSKEALAFLVKGLKRDASERQMNHIGANFGELINKYELDHYNVYFCPGVKKTWIQNSAVAETKKPHNPYTHKIDCGEQITHY